MKKVKLNYIQLVFLAALFISPLIFFTGVTRNPYLIQERILQVLLSFSVLMLFIKSKGLIKFPVTFLDRPLWFFFLIALVSYLLSFLRYPDFRWSFLHYGLIRNLMFIFSGLTVFYFTAGSRDNFTEKIKKAVIAAGSIAALYAVVQFFNSVIDSVNFDFIWGEALDPYGERSISTFGNPNFLSAYLMVTIFWIMGYIFTEKKVMWGFLFVLNTSALAITMTRSTLVSFVLGVAALIFILSYQYGRKYRRFKKAMLAIFSAIILVGFLFFGISDQFRQRVRAMASTQEMGSALVQRLLIWESSANMFIEDPVIGRGWGNFEVFYPFYQGKVVEKEEYRPLRTHANNAHNFMLEILTQTGIVGAGIYIWLMVVFVVFAIRIFKAADEKDKIWVAVFAVAAISFWIDNLLNVSLYFPLPALAFWVNAGLLASKGRKNYLNPHKTINFRKFKIILLFVCMAVAGVLYFNYIYFKSNVYFFKGFKYARMNKLEQAEDKFLKAWNIYPLIVDNNYELGNIYVSMSRSKEQDKLKQAAWAYKQALRANPGYDEIYYNLGVVYLMQGNNEEAKKYLKETLDINPLSENTYLTLGDIYGRKGDYESAIELYEKALSIGAQSVRLYNNMGFYLQKAGNISAALDSYINALKLDPEFTQARSNIHRLESSPEKIFDSGEIESFFAAAEAYIDSQEWEKALREIKKVLDVNPASLRALIYAGNIYYKLGKTELAKEQYSTVLLIDPDNKTASRNLQAIRN